MLTLKMAHNSFVALTSIIQRRLFVLPSELMVLLQETFHSLIPSLVTIMETQLGS